MYYVPSLRPTLRDTYPSSASSVLGTEAEGNRQGSGTKRYVGQDSIGSTDSLKRIALRHRTGIMYQDVTRGRRSLLLFEDFRRSLISSSESFLDLSLTTV